MKWVVKVGDDASLPIHSLELSDFWMAEFPVTQDVWEAVMGSGNNPSYFKGKRRPVERVTWELIENDFLPALNQVTKNKGAAYRFPSEAEWEYASRAGQNNEVF